MFQELSTDDIDIDIEEDNKVEINGWSKNSINRGLALATGSSWLGNWILLVLKIVVVVFSNSKAVSILQTKNDTSYMYDEKISSLFRFLQLIFFFIIVLSSLQFEKRSLLCN